MKKEIRTKYGYIVEYEDNEEVRNEVFNRVMEFFIKHDAFAAEIIGQADNPIIDAPHVLMDIADDIIKFRYIETDTEI